MTDSRYLSFTLGTEQFAIPLLTVKEVLGTPEFTPIPFAPKHYLGVMNLRGQVLSVLDLRSRMGIRPSPEKNLEKKDDVVIICDLGTTTMGVVVDSIQTVLRLTEDDLSPKPQSVDPAYSKAIQSICRLQDQLIFVLDIYQVLGMEKQSESQAA